MIAAIWLNTLIDMPVDPQPEQRAGHRAAARSVMITKGCRKLSNWRREHQEHDQERQHEHEVQPSAGLLELARLPVVVERGSRWHLPR